MAVISFGQFDGDSIVVHFGGEQRAINAYTFSQSLTGFADTARAVSFTIDPGHEIEIVIEAIGPGSFRTRVRRLKKAYGGMFTGAVGAVFWGIVANVIYENYIKFPDPPPEIIINTNEVIIVRGKDRYIVPRAIHEAAENAKQSPDVKRGVRNTFEPLRKDPRVTEFGLTNRIDDPVPVLMVPRSEFPRIIESITVVEESPTDRIRSETARLIISKAWLNKPKRKWSFEWNGVPVSAPIADEEFLQRLERREHLIGAGDALDVEIAFMQIFDPALEVYVNDPYSFIITKVYHHVSRG